MIARNLIAVPHVDHTAPLASVSDAIRTPHGRIDGTMLTVRLEGTRR